MSIVSFNGKNPVIAKSAFVAQSAELVGEVTVEETASILYHAVLRGEKPIVVGEKSNVQDNCVVHGEKTCVFIGERVTIGHGAIVEDSEIGDDSLVGAGAIIFNSKIGKNCLIGAGAVLKPGTAIPDNSFVVGAPAIVKREITEENKKEIEHAWKYYVEKMQHGRA